MYVYNALARPTLYGCFCMCVLTAPVLSLYAEYLFMYIRCTEIRGGVFMCVCALIIDNVDDILTGRDTHLSLMHKSARVYSLGTRFVLDLACE